MNNRRGQNKIGGGGGSEYSRVAMIYYLKCPVFNKNCRIYEETGKYDTRTREKSREGICESNQVSDLFNRDRKVGVVSVFKYQWKPCLKK